MVWYSAPPASAPDPRLTARSMLSFGTDDFFAFWMASYSVGLPPGSPPPIRAATSMFLMSLAKSLPRRASMTAFLCLVVAHLEWPDMPGVPPLVRCCGAAAQPRSGRGSAGRLAHDVHEQLVEARVAGHLRVEGRGEQVALTDRDDPTRGRTGGHGRDHLDVRTHILHPGRADEHRVEGALQLRHVEVGLEGVDLPAEGVAADDHVEAADRLLVRGATLDPVGQQDHPGAGAEHRHPVLGGLAEGLEQVEVAGQLRHRRRLTARQDESVDRLELRGTAYRLCLRPRALEHAEVLTHVALEGEHAYANRGIHASIVGGGPQAARRPGADPTDQRRASRSAGQRREADRLLDTVPLASQLSPAPPQRAQGEGDVTREQVDTRCPGQPGHDRPGVRHAGEDPGRLEHLAQLGVRHAVGVALE